MPWRWEGQWLCQKPLHSINAVFDDPDSFLCASYRCVDSITVGLDMKEAGDVLLLRPIPQIS